MANIPYSVISKPFIAKPKELCSDKYFVIGSDDEEVLADKVAKYMKTKMFRFLLSLKKSTPVAAKKTYSFIPLQEFKSKVGINWSFDIKEMDEEANQKYDCTTINKIDAQLYNKYDLTKEEVQFIEKMIKPME